MERDLFTAALHADAHIAESPDIAPPIRPSTTFKYSEDGRVYKRLSDETTERLEAVIGSLEGGHSVAYPSGMAAAAAVLRYIRPRRIALPDDVYHGVGVFVTGEAERGTWELCTPDQLGPGDVWWIETPSNPKCLITDLAAAAGAAAERKALTVVDATFATPVLQQTLGFGVDFSMHATTKFIAGHSDAMGGVVSSADASVAEELRSIRINDGAIPGTLESWLTLRGARTLPLRAIRQSETAQEVAEFLMRLVPTVWYPGLPTHPGHDIAARQMSAFGGVVSFEVDDPQHAAAVVDRLEVFANATSLGGVESLAEYRRRSDPAAPLGLVRLSIGLESPEALVGDLERALAQ